MIGLTIGAVIAALAAMAWTFGALRRLEDSVRDLEERSHKKLASLEQARLNVPPTKERKR